ncbi:hypothetical protein AAAY20_18540 [Bacteroides thetaiotaomicron]|mgnify:CR=1 FL=1|uniref:hypothetical protein n=1 Tax=Bacteroides thetaiotaomicron TaxID=818 RepID=UPI0032C0118F
MAKKVTGKIAASAASKVLRDGRTSAASKTAAGSALSQREKENKQPKKERREIYFELRSFNIYSSSRRKR